MASKPARIKIPLSRSDGPRPFVTKIESIDWAIIDELDPDKISENTDDVTLEELYPLIVNVSVDMGDPKATPDNLIKLFRLTQLAMEVKHRFLEDSERQIAALQAQQMARTPTQNTPSRSRLGTLGGSQQVFGVSSQALSSAMIIGGPMTESPETSMQDLAARDNEISTLRADLDDMTRQANQLRIDHGAAEEAAETERLTAMQLRDELRSERAKARDAETMVDALQATVRELRAKEVKNAQLVGRKSEEAFRAEIREKNALITKYLGEVQVLAAKVSEFQAESQAVTAELEAVVSELERVCEENVEMKKYIAKVEERVERVELDRDALDIKVKELGDELIRK
ncbi:hypothetical protein BCR44DRAFT_135867, partial [Catenaria anguillulae PL171]